MSNVSAAGLAGLDGTQIHVIVGFVGLLGPVRDLSLCDLPYPCFIFPGRATRQTSWSFTFRFTVTYYATGPYILSSISEIICQFGVTSAPLSRRDNP